MFEKLLSLLLQAKGGAVATVFVLGTSGALVTATIDNGLTTITIAETAATTTASETAQGGSTTTNTTVTEAILALFNRTNAEDGTTEPATGGNGCSDEAHARNEQMKRVNEASKDAREDVKALGRDAGKSADAKELVRDADTEIKDLRQAAVKNIHGTFDCDKDEEETGTTSGTSDGTTTTTTTTNGEDAEAIADKAIQDMEKVVEELEAALEGLEDEAADEDDSDEATATGDEKQNGKSDKAKNDKNKGKGNGKGRD